MIRALIRSALGLQPLPWDERLAARLPGKYVIVGLRYVGLNGAPDRLEQKHGVIAKADRREGIAIELQGSERGEFHWMPPQTSILQRAKPGTYRLKESGDVIEDPDYLATWVVTPPGGD